MLVRVRCDLNNAHKRTRLIKAEAHSIREVCGMHCLETVKQFGLLFHDNNNNKICHRSAREQIRGRLMSVGNAIFFGMKQVIKRLRHSLH